MSRPLCVGLTGGIGSGKTTTTDIFAELGVPVIDADTISHEVVEAGRPALKDIVKTFGPDLVDDNGNLRRAHLRTLVFNDQSARRKLESIIHPEVRREITRRIDAVTFPYCIISIPLLIESSSRQDIDRILVVDVPESLQIQRASQRDESDANEIAKIVQSQIGRQDRLDAADDIIENDGDLEYLRSQVETIHKKYLELATKRVNRFSS